MTTDKLIRSVRGATIFFLHFFLSIVHSWENV